MPTNIKLNFTKKILHNAILANVNAALKEDLGEIDKTSQLISKSELGFYLLYNFYDQKQFFCESMISTFLLIVRG